ncbi:putative bifunctional diguanylate cyclase/phosphodiesterase [Yoonia sp. SDW83-1]|uniref:putative bifunctional diguanylate cyclase/phosphodiesterase n=1 Tax=Yoonia sp. SDW83-1 TaxID=3366945 RepID=UPI00398C46D7
MKAFWSYRFFVRHWTIRRIVVTIPAVGILVVMLMVLLGLNMAERRLAALQETVKTSLNYQHTALQLPVLVEEIHGTLHELEETLEDGADPAEIAELRQDILYTYNRINTLRQKLDPRVRKLDLEYRMDALDRVVNEAQTNDIDFTIHADLQVESSDHELDATATLFAAMAAQTRILALRDLAAVEQGSVRLIWTFFLAVGVVGSLLSLGALWAARLISRPILAIAHTVEALESGNLDADIPATLRQDEIGKVARAMESFKSSLQRNRRLESERDDLNRNLERKVAARTSELAIERERLAQTQREAEQQRREMATQLRAEFGRVINAARAGDFKQRVGAHFADDNLQALADDINRFVTRVDDSVGAISKAMHDLANGEFASTKDHEFTGAFADIMTQVRETAAQIRDQSGQLTHIALHDALTELPNRRFLEDRLTAYTKLLAFGDMPLAVLHIDLDRFKEINDTMGHAAGDQVLKRAAAVLTDLSGNDDFIARVGGDEFIMLCPMLDCAPLERQRIERLGDGIVSALAEPIMIEDEEARFGASVGIAFSTSETQDLSSLVVDADIALYQAKEAGRNQAQVFSASIATALSQRRSLRDDLLAAVERDEFVPFFQPKYDANTLEMTGVEALARWQHPTKGLLTPDQFLAAANDVKIVHDIDQQVLWKATCVLNDLWDNHGLRIPELSVNISQQRLFDPMLLRSLDGLIGDFRVSFELLESIFFDEQGDKFHWMLDQLRERGIGVQIDDFGSGRASISALMNIGPERLKIDRHLVQPILEREANAQLIKGIVDIARSMDIGVTAEGVETMQHADLLRDLGCDTLQGYAFARPMSAEALKEFGLRKAS